MRLSPGLLADERAEALVWQFRLGRADGRIFIQSVGQVSPSARAGDDLEKDDGVTRVLGVGPSQSWTASAPVRSEASYADLVTEAALHCVFTGDLSSFTSFGLDFTMESADAQFSAAVEVVKVVVVVAALASGDPGVVHAAFSWLVDDAVVGAVDQTVAAPFGRFLGAEAPRPRLTASDLRGSSQAPDAVPLGPSKMFREIQLLLEGPTREPDPQVSVGRPGTRTNPRRTQVVRPTDPFPGGPSRPADGASTEARARPVRPVRSRRRGNSADTPAEVFRTTYSARRSGPDNDAGVGP